MTLLEALEHAEIQDKFCVVTRLGTHTKVDLDTEDISKYVIYITEREIQRYTNVWYYSLYVIIDKPTCKMFVDTLKSHQKGIINGMTLEEIIDLMDNYLLSEIKFILTSCIKQGLLEKQGDLYAWG